MTSTTPTVAKLGGAWLLHVMACDIRQSTKHQPVLVNGVHVLPIASQNSVRRCAQPCHQMDIVAAEGSGSCAAGGVAQGKVFALADWAAARRSLEPAKPATRYGDHAQ